MALVNVTKYAIDFIASISASENSGMTQKMTAISFTKVRWRRIKAGLKLIKKIYWRDWAYPAKLKDIFHNMALIFCSTMIFMISMSRPNYFPWGTQFPKYSELMEIRGTLSRHVTPPSRGGSVESFKVKNEQGTMKLACENGSGKYNRDNCALPSPLKWGGSNEVIVRYAPKWGLIEVASLDGEISSTQNYKKKLARIKMWDNIQTGCYVFAFSVIFEAGKPISGVQQ
ncbi:MAG: hypothetical protein LBJ59_06970 [Zoogloeaceae bacterium]|nr:hypothetical protein [Zoogloeaceae bacterium]